MSFPGQGNQFSNWPYPSSTTQDEQYLDDYLDPAAQDGAYSEACLDSPLQEHAQLRQQQLHLSTPRTLPGTTTDQWQRRIYGNQQVGQQLNVHADSYYGDAVMSNANSFTGPYQDRSSHSVQDNLLGYPSQDHRALSQHYILGSRMEANTSTWPHGYPARHTAELGHSQSPRTEAAYQHHPQTAQGIGGSWDQAPLLRVDAPRGSDRDSLDWPIKSGRYPDDGLLSFSTSTSATSPLLSPHSQIKEDESQASERSTPDAQMSPSPSRANDKDKADRKWNCKQPECADRRGFKRHADLMRHMTTVHHKGDMEKFSCPRRGCPRKAENGFTRKDHLTEHLRNFHVQDIPKRKGGRGKTRED